MDERAIVAFRLAFNRTINEGETEKELHAIPRIKTGWPCERDMAKWPIADQAEWCCAPTLHYLEEGMRDGSESAMNEAWARIFEYLEHIGVDMNAKFAPGSALRDASLEVLVLDHYRRGINY